VQLPLEFNALTHVEVQQPTIWAAVVPKLRAVHFTSRKGWMCPERNDQLAWAVGEATKCRRYAHEGSGV
jgi:hypothetical protein